jgi:hypothetical protein
MVVQHELRKQTETDHSTAEQFVMRYRLPRGSEQGGGRCQAQTAPRTLS